MLVCYNKKCEKTPYWYAARFFKKNDFSVRSQLVKKNKKVPKTHNFEGSSEISEGPKNTSATNKIFILMCSKRFKSWLVIWTPQKSLIQKVLHQQNFLFSPKNSVVGAEISGYRGTQKKFFSKSPWVSL